MASLFPPNAGIGWEGKGVMRVICFDAPLIARAFTFFGISLS